MMLTRNGDCYILYNGSPGAKGDDGAKATRAPRATPVRTALRAQRHQVWLAEGNAGTVDDFMQAIAGPKGDPGAPGKDGKDGVNGAVGAPGLSATRSGSGSEHRTIADFLHLDRRPAGAEGRQGRHRRDWRPRASPPTRRGSRSGTAARSPTSSTR